MKHLSVHRPNERKFRHIRFTTRSFYQFQRTTWMWQEDFTESDTRGKQFFLPPLSDSGYSYLICFLLRFFDAQ